MSGAFVNTDDILSFEAGTDRGDLFRLFNFFRRRRLILVIKSLSWYD